MCADFFIIGRSHQMTTNKVSQILAQYLIMNLKTLSISYFFLFTLRMYHLLLGNLSSL